MFIVVGVTMCLLTTSVHAGYFADNRPSEHCLTDPDRAWIYTDHGDEATTTIVHNTRQLEKMYIFAEAAHGYGSTDMEKWVDFQNIGRLIVQGCELLPLNAQKTSPHHAKIAAIVQDAATVFLFDAIASSLPEPIMKN